jgi:hypothetical protein
MHSAEFDDENAPDRPANRRIPIARDRLEVVSKPHLRPSGCVAPRSGIRAIPITLRCITDLR